MEKQKTRSEIEEKYKWDLTDFFKDVNEFEECFKVTDELITNLENYKNCTKDANKMYEFLNIETDAVCKWLNLFVYANCINDQELGISENIERFNRTNYLNAKLGKNTSFFSPELLKLDEKEYNDLFQKNPKLLEYKFDLDKIYRKKEHILTETEEKIINELTSDMDCYESIRSTLLNKEHDYGKIKLDDGSSEIITTTNFRKLLKESDREHRKIINDKFYKVLDQYGSTEASLLNAYVKKNDVISKLYHYNSSWDKKLFSLNMSNKVFETLVNVTEKSIPSLQRYFNIKKRALNLDELYEYDLPLNMAHSNKKYTIEDAQSLARKALEPLGEDYLKCFDKIINNRYVDYCQYKGKCSGGYSISTLDRDSRILMSFNDDLESISTLIHEAGHNIHHQYINMNNPVIYRESPSIVAEVASLTNECLLSSYLAKNGTTKEEKLAGIANILEVIVSNLFGAVREGKMEQEMYEHVQNGYSLTKDYLDDLTLESLKKYYGDSIKLDNYSNCGWIRRSHYYMNFYLYSYAICVCVASYIAFNILEKNEDILNKYYKFLSTGSDVWPYDIFKIIDVDLEDEKVYIEAIKYFDSLLDQFEELLDN